MTERAFNTELAGTLRDRHPHWRGRAVLPEATGVFRDHLGKSPDIVVSGPNGVAVVLETEYTPARTVEADALSRLGETIDSSGQTVAAVVAVRVPVELSRADPSQLSARISSCDLEYCCYTVEDQAGPTRFPSSGWLLGGIDDLAGLVERMTVPESAIITGSEILESGVRDAANRLGTLAGPSQPVLDKIASVLRQEECEQTRRMAMAICANAFVFQTAIAGTHDNILGPSDTSLLTQLGRLQKSKVLEAWEDVLTINYWPIFRLAYDILAPIPQRVADDVLNPLVAAAVSLADLGAAATGDLAGQMFGRLITDRKFLATFYTLPSSSALLAELAVARLPCDYGNRMSVTNMRIADLACGTGALVSAAYRAIAARYRRHGGDDGDLHAEMMERVLVGADIMPAATHLTASTLSSIHPTVPFGDTSIYTMTYGQQPDSQPIAIGSLELLGNEKALSLFGTGRTAAGGSGVVSADDSGREAVVTNGSVDLVVMNPPFTRSTNHEGAAAGTPRPAFAGFDTSENEQRQMASRLNDIYRGMPSRAGHGNAGLASNFVDLAHAKAKAGGVVALVLPVAVASGRSWMATRQLLEKEYTDTTVVTIASTGSTERAFSADTGMAEAIIIATKRPARSIDATPLGVTDAKSSRVLWVSLLTRPLNVFEAVEHARAISRGTADPDQTSGHLFIGDKIIGCFTWGGWADGGCAGVANPEVTKTAQALSHGYLRLPRRTATRIPLTPLATLGRRGPLDRDISGTARSQAGKSRGPFDIQPLPPAGPPSYPVLWGHDAARERKFVVEPDTQGTVRRDMHDEALNIWDAASRLHLNRDFQLNSQSLAACLTPSPCIGGRAWPNYILDGKDSTDVAAREKLAALWMNSTLGLIAFWWLGTRQQQGRSVLTISRLPDLPMVNFQDISAEQLKRGEAVFDDLSDQDFRAAHEAHKDLTRQELDRALLIDVLGLSDDLLEPLAVVREQWCSEPTVHGGKQS